MKKLFTALILFACAGVPAYAQGNVLVPEQGRPGTALIFSLYGLNTLRAADFGSFAGPLDSLAVGFGIKHFISPRLALRAGLGFSSASVTQDLQTGENPVTLKTTALRFALLPGIEYHLLRTAALSAYVGGQLVFGIVNMKNETSGAGSTTDSFEVNATFFGAGPYLGVEWFAFTNVSLGAEYQLNFITASGKDKTTQNGVTTEVDLGPKNDLRIASSGRLSLNVAFYF